MQNKNYESINETKPFIKGEKKGHFGRNILILFIVIILVALPFMVHLYSNSKIDGKLRALTAVPHGDCLLDYDQSKYNIWSKHLIIQNLTVTCANQQVARFGILDILNFNNTAFLLSDFSANFVDTTLYINSQKFGKYAEAATYLGYNSLDMAGTIDFTYNPTSTEFAIKKAVVDVVSVGRVDVELTVNNIVANSTADAFAQIISTPYDNLWVKFTNAGLVDRVISAYAKHSLIDIIKAKQRSLAAVDRYIKRVPATNPDAKDQLVSLYRFIEKPKEVVFVSNRNKPASIAQVVETIDAETFKGIVQNISNLPIVMRSN